MKHLLLGRKNVILRAARSSRWSRPAGFLFSPHRLPFDGYHGQFRFSPGISAIGALGQAGR